MKISEMTADQIRHLALKLNDSGKMPLAKMQPIDALRSGNFWAWVARTEECKRYWRAAKADLRKREINGTSYNGDAGHVTINGKRFSFYPASGMIVRDDFATWCEAHFGDYFFPTGRMRAEPKPERQEDVEVDAALHMWKEIRARAQKLDNVHRFYPDAAWHDEWTMRRDLQALVGAMADCAKHGELYPVLKCDCDLLASKIAYRQKKFAQCKDHLLNLAAAAMRAALLVQEHHAAKEEQTNGDN